MAGLDHAFVRAFARTATPPQETMNNLAPAAVAEQKYAGSAPLQASPSSVALEPASDESEDSPVSWSWPDICPRLMATVDFAEFGERLWNSCRTKGLRSVALGGASRGVGRSTLLLTLAQALCQAKPGKLLLVDASFENPNLAKELSTIPDREPVALIPDKLHLLSLASFHSVTDARLVWPEILETIAAAAEGFDLVLIDGGAWPDRPGLWSRPPVDAVIQVGRHGATDFDGLKVEAQACRAVGIELLGRIETFA